MSLGVINDVQANICNLVASIATQKPVTVVYTDLDGVTSIRLVQPRSIFRSLNEQTTVEAFDLNRQAVRHFRITSFGFVGGPGEEVSI